jgi:hypothetical protein
LKKILSNFPIKQQLKKTFFEVKTMFSRLDLYLYLPTYHNAKTWHTTTKLIANATKMVIVITTIMNAPTTTKY